MLNLWMIAGVELWFDQMFLKGSRDARTARIGEEAAASARPHAQTVLPAGAH
jgi:hypothetical protein